MTPKELSDLAHNTFNKPDTPRIDLPLYDGSSRNIVIATICFTLNNKGDWNACVDDFFMEDIVMYYAKKKGEANE